LLIHSDSFALTNPKHYKQYSDSRATFDHKDDCLVVGGVTLTAYLWYLTPPPVIS